MKTLIENYRGWDIYFDTDKEDFYTVSNEYDKEQTKRSYASTKKFIDDYIKDNLNFKPIRVESMPSSYDIRKQITLIGLRKDGIFIYVDADGNTKQLSKFNEKDFFLIKPENEPLFKKIEELDNRIKQLQLESVEISKKIIKVNVSEIRKKLLGD